MCITRPAAFARRRRGFSIVEIVVIIGIIMLVLAILLPALAGARRSALMTNSQSNLRQIATWMQIYTKDNREIILPSEFDYSGNPFPGKVRSVVTIGNPHEGTWADILWTINELGAYGGEVIDPVSGSVVENDYRFDSPDLALYEAAGDRFPNPLRSAASNTKSLPGVEYGSLAKPYGPGANEQGLPGYFAANNFFSARPDAEPLPGDEPEYPPAIGRWYTTGQIRLPAKSVYLVDSFAGEVIDPTEAPWRNRHNPTGPPTSEIDFRYSGTCLMLFLDGHSEARSPWEELCDLQKAGIRVRALDKRSDPQCP
jgi:type II secretory pathway pseudopilin PulG